jgi:uncharacterized protein
MESKDVKKTKRVLYHAAQKVRRTFTSFLPINKNRHGDCSRCGVCCTMGWTCPFLKYVEENGKRLAACGIRKIRPLNCRKYPRVKSEQIIFPCGYNFENGDGKTE